MKEYILYSRGFRTNIVDKDLDRLIKRAKLHHNLFGGEYEIRDAADRTVWKLGESN